MSLLPSFKIKTRTLIHLISNKYPSSFIALLELVPPPQEKHVFKKQRCAASSYRGKHSSTSFVAPKRNSFQFRFQEFIFIRITHVLE